MSDAPQRRAVLGQVVGGDLLKALGMEGRLVTGITIRLRVGEVATMFIREYADRDQMAAGVQIIGRYRLVEDPPA